MRIQYLSDLHLESCAFTLKVRDDADVLVLGGDIATAKHTVRLEKLLTETLGKPTIYLYGNHEFYNNSMDDAKRQIDTVCRRYPNVYLLDDQWVNIKGIQFVGSTLWSDFKLPLSLRGKYESDPEAAMRLAGEKEMGIRDFSVVGYDSRLFRPHDAAALHAKARRFIELASRCGPTVVCTHFLPSSLSIDPVYKDSSLNPYFASNCEDLMGGNVRAWLHGHTHHSCGYKVNGTLVACNPRGYRDTENKNFDSQAVIDIQI